MAREDWFKTSQTSLRRYLVTHFAVPRKRSLFVQVSHTKLVLHLFMVILKLEYNSELCSYIPNLRLSCTSSLL